MALIEREALLVAYDAAHKGPPDGTRKLIEEAPEVVSEGRHGGAQGRWERRKSSAGFIYYTCSACENCNWVDGLEALSKYYYCPQCGAAMKGCERINDDG